MTDIPEVNSPKQHRIGIWLVLAIFSVCGIAGTFFLLSPTKTSDLEYLEVFHPQWEKPGLIMNPGPTGSSEVAQIIKFTQPPSEILAAIRHRLVDELKWFESKSARNSIFTEPTGGQSSLVFSIDMRTFKEGDYKCWLSFTHPASPTDALKLRVKNMLGQ